MAAVAGLKASCLLSPRVSKDEVRWTVGGSFARANARDETSSSHISEEFSTIAMGIPDGVVVYGFVWVCVVIVWVSG